MGSGGIAPRILNLDSRWRWVVGFTPRPLYPQAKCLRYPMDRKIGWLQSRYGRSDEDYPRPYRNTHHCLPYQISCKIPRFNCVSWRKRIHGLKRPKRGPCSKEIGKWRDLCSKYTSTIQDFIIVLIMLPSQTLSRRYSWYCCKQALNSVNACHH
jgi:hypothetical protein